MLDKFMQPKYLERVWCVYATQQSLAGLFLAVIGHRELFLEDQMNPKIGVIHPTYTTIFPTQVYDHKRFKTAFGPQG